MTTQSLHIKRHIQIKGEITMEANNKGALRRTGIIQRLIHTFKIGGMAGISSQRSIYFYITLMLTWSSTENNSIWVIIYSASTFFCADSLAFHQYLT